MSADSMIPISKVAVKSSSEYDLEYGGGNEKQRTSPSPKKAKACRS
jgi:hypothetical protein